MKRSEMAKILRDVMADYDIKEDIEVISQILASIEEAGMTPPNTLNPRFRGGHSIDIESFYVREWDPEDGVAEEDLRNQQAIDEAATRSAQNMGEPGEMWDAEYGLVFHKGELTEAGIRWYQSKDLFEPKG
jgi:hypothetical protein